VSRCKRTRLLEGKGKGGKKRSVSRWSLLPSFLRSDGNAHATHAVRPAGVQLEAAFLLGAALAVCWKSVFGWRLHALHGSSECACMLMLQGFGGWPAAGFWTAYVARGEDPIRGAGRARAQPGEVRLGLGTDADKPADARTGACMPSCFGSCDAWLS
jgi:hypothetical protein